MIEAVHPVRVDVESRCGASILVADGELNSFTYRRFRDAMIKAALDQPRVMVVDVNRLTVPSASAWSVFTSARWHVSTWPDVPILLVSNDSQQRNTIRASGVTRYVPVHSTCDAALVAAAEAPTPCRRRARAELPRSQASVRLARGMVGEWLTAWSRQQMAPTVSTVATIFIENVLDHTESAPALIVEAYEDTITVAVEDASGQPASRLEAAECGTEILSGLSMVSVLSRAWGSTPTSSGKTVWAVIGLEDRL
ncbi:sulfate transporter [Mycobacterium asiaticum]|uniref:Sulfate transporter n=1 Tax=Mycobacterium asiaticum TaxID=1790 RepID=A0A1A3PCR0_MYCAS|nr:STAS domain-containing protein [Mycobacterium asiaticum]OBK31094.1 sulfate transporter [Mycobacterium asiaticum]